MSISSVYRLSMVQLPGTSVYLKQIESAQVSAGVQAALHKGAGEILPSFRATERQQPIITFRTSALGTLLDNVGFTGLKISATPLYLYFRLATETANTAIATASHLRVAVNLGLIYWNSITLPNSGQGTAEVTVCAAYNGTNAPLVYTGSVAVPSQPISAEYFSAGPVTLNGGAAISSVQSITVNSGISTEKLNGSSEVFDTWVGINAADASVNVECLDRINLSGSGIDTSGVAISGTTKFYARKRAQGGFAPVSDATAEHIEFTVGAGRIIPDTTSGDGARPVSDRFMIDPITSDGTTALITYDTTAAIT